MIGGLDIGTTNAKFTVYDHGVPLAEESRAYVPGAINGRLSAHVVWDTVLDVIGCVCNKIYPNRIRALAISAFGEAVIPVDQSGIPLTDIFLGGAPGGEQELEEVEKKIPAAAIHEITGLVPNKRFPLLRIRWLQKNTDLYSKTAKFYTTEDYIIFRLTGMHVTSTSSASRTMAMDWATGKWSQKLLSAAQIDEDKLPEILPSAQAVGFISRQISEHISALNGAVVYTGGHDQLCNAIGAGVFDSSSVLNCCGTVECVAAVIGYNRLSKAPQNLQWSKYPGSKEQIFSFYAPVFGASVLDHYIRSVYGANITPQQLLQKHLELQKHISSYPVRAMATPYLHGRNYPDLDEKAKMRFGSISDKTPPCEIYQSLMEGIAFESRICMDHFDVLHKACQRVRATGGGSNSDIWLQIKANIFNTPVERLIHRQSGTMGAGLLALMGLEHSTTLENFTHSWFSVDTVFEPQKNAAAMYQEKFGAYLTFRNSNDSQESESCL